MNELLKELYQEIILDHGKEPRNFGECETHNKSAHGHNPLCGDKVSLTLFIDDDDIIKALLNFHICINILINAGIITSILLSCSIKYKKIMI